MDGLLHAQRAGIILAGVIRYTFSCGEVSDTLDPVRGKPGDDHRSNYTLCRPYTARLSCHSPGSCRSGECCDVAGYAACRQGRPPDGWRWICARLDYTLHGADRPGHGGSVCAYWAAPVQSLNSKKGTDTLLGTEKWGAGRTAVAACANSGSTVAILANQIWSFAGDPGRADVNLTFLQPFISYTTKDAWTYTLNSEWSLG